MPSSAGRPHRGQPRLGGGAGGSANHSAQCKHPGAAHRRLIGPESHHCRQAKAGTSARECRTRSSPPRSTPPLRRSSKRTSASRNSSTPRSTSSAATPARIQQILANLLSNAIKYTPPGRAHRHRAGAHQFPHRDFRERQWQGHLAGASASHLRSILAGPGGLAARGVLGLGLEISPPRGAPRRLDPRQEPWRRARSSFGSIFPCR